MACGQFDEQFAVDKHEAVRQCDKTTVCVPRHFRNGGLYVVITLNGRCKCGHPKLQRYCLKMSQVILS